jgi:tetratricopeptide (TPR) repeat protein
MLKPRSPLVNSSQTTLRILFLLLAAIVPTATSSAQLGQVGGAGFIIFGRVYLPDGRPVQSRVKIFAEGPQGMQRDTFSDDDGNYELKNLNRGRYRVTAVNPKDPEQYVDPIEADTNRSYANRLQIDILLKYPLHNPDRMNVNPGVVDADDAQQGVPKAARKAYDDGLRYQKANLPDQALTHFTEAINLHPKYYQALTERANLLMQRNQLDEAEAGFKSAVALNDKYAPALRGLGACHLQQKRFKDALPYLEQAYVLDSNAPLTLLLLGYANLSLDRYDDAKQCLQQALKLGPTVAARAHVYLAEIYAHDKQFKEAAESIKTYLKLKPNASDAAHLKELEAQWLALTKPGSQD